jgi:hypothetical protein
MMRSLGRKLGLSLAVGSVLLVLASPALATPLTLPPGLNPGDPYRVAFVTSTGRDATSGDISDYNIFVKSIANAAPALVGLGNSWRAIVSTRDVDARDNTNTNVATDGQGVPIYLPDGTLIALDYADLWDGDLLSPLDITETLSVSSGIVWTGTQEDGTALLPIGSSNTRTGTSASSSGDWTSLGSLGNFQTHPLYGISELLTAVPEPGTGILLGLGLFAGSIRSFFGGSARSSRR